MSSNLVPFGHKTGQKPFQEQLQKHIKKVMAQSRQSDPKPLSKGVSFFMFWSLFGSRDPPGPQNIQNIVLCRFSLTFPTYFYVFYSILGRFRDAFLASPLLHGFCPTARRGKNASIPPYSSMYFWVPAAGRVQVFLVPAG